MWSLQTYTGLSLISIMAVVYYAFHSSGQFYPTMIYLSTSKISLALVLNMGLVFMCILWQLTKKVFLGSLREAEVERLNEQTWREVIEIMFAITIFKQEFSVSFLAMVIALLLIKGLHWLAETRVEYIETIETVTAMSHIRIASFIGFLFLVDIIFLYNFLKPLLETHQASVSLFFSFEYLILAMTTMSTFVKYIFCVSDMLMEGQWEKRSVYTFYLDLIHDLLHLSMYLCFFALVFINYGVPLHLIRELYETFHNFKVRVADYIRYRKITSNLNERFPDATPEELSRGDATCIICREEMTTAKRLICSHLFHVRCLRSWLERQHTCPTCRALVWPHESITTTINRALESQTDVDQQASSSASHGSSSTCELLDDDNSSSDQARKRVAAANAAASVYGRSFVYPSPAILIWNPGYTVLSQGNGPFLNPTSTNCFDRQSSLGVPSTSMMLSDANNFNMIFSQLDTQIKFIENQINVLQNQLGCLERARDDEMASSADPGSSDTKGKAIAYSSVTGSGSP